jgi:metal-sulfur cluster biosynthetic enzyme
MVRSEKIVDAARPHGQQRAEALAAINEIVDPCSAGVGVPIGLTEMGLIEELTLGDGHVVVTLMTTAPHCMFVGLLEEEIEQRVSALAWVKSVRVERSSCETVWDDSRMSEAARERLIERHRLPRGRVLPQAARPLQAEPRTRAVA